MASGPVVWLTPFHVAEWTHAVEQQVFRRAASRTEADQSYERFQQHRESGLWVEVALPESAFEVCAQLARRHGASLGLRTLDTLHVASALELKAEHFWTFDERQKRLARDRGPENRLTCKTQSSSAGVWYLARDSSRGACATTGIKSVAYQ